MSASPGPDPLPAQGPKPDEPAAVDSDSLQRVVLPTVPKGGRVLLLGSTGEAWACKMRDLGCRLIVLEKDRRSALRMAPYAERVIVNTLAWPELKSEIPQGPYDAIVSVGLIETSPDPVAVLRDLKDRLTPEGHLVVACANFAHAGMRVSLLETGTLPLESEGAVASDHVNYITRSRLEEMIEQAGFLIGRFDRVRQSLETMPGVPSKLDAKMRERLEADPDATTSHFVVVGYPSNLPYLQAIQERMRGMAEQLETLLRERAETETRHARERAETEASHAKKQAALEKHVRVQGGELSDLLDLTRRQGSQLTELKNRQQVQEAQLAAQKTKLREAQATEEAYAVLLAELRRVKESPGWKLNTAYRRWVKKNIWSRPGLMRIYEGVFSLVSGRLAPADVPPAGQGMKAPATPAPVSRQAEEIEAKSLSRNAPKAAPNAPPTEFRIRLDHPEPDSKRTLAGRVLVRGWALASSPIESVFVQMGDGPEYLAVYGKTRRDVAEVHPEYNDAAKSGFEVRWNIPRGQGGLHQLRIIVITTEGARGELVREVLLDDRDAYEIWVRRNALSDVEKEDMLRESEGFARRPLISVVTPVYRTDLRDLEHCVESVFAQIYSNWELCLVDDGSNDASLTEALQGFVAKDSRVKIIALEKNSGIAGATNAGIEAATGDYVAFLDHDDEIAIQALYEVVRAVNQDRKLEVFYSDEDKIDPEGNRFGHFFKPDWSPDLIHGMNYICYFLVSKRDLLNSIDGLRLGFDGAQDYDLILRLSEKTNAIKRINGVLYHWRAAAGSTAVDVGNKPAASDAGRRALADHAKRVDLDADVVETGPGRYRMRYRIQGEPRVSILIPTGGRVDRLEEAVESVCAETDYPNYEVVVIDNSADDRTRKLVERHESLGRSIRRLDYQSEEFNFSRLCNSASRNVDGDFLLFLNDDITVIAREWLTAMVEHGQRETIGAVGARLLFPDRQIQHAGVVLGVFGTAGHCFKGIDADEQHYGDLPELVRNCLAVTGACLLVDRARFWEVGGFDEENLPIAFQDVDFCLKLHEAGYRNVYTPHAELYHHEASSKSDAQFTPSDPEVAYMRSRWGKYIDDDPYYNPHLTREAEDFSLRL